MPDLLLELLSEEIPAGMQKRAAEDLLADFTARLTRNSLDYSNAVSHVTPRRLVLAIAGLPERQADAKEERKGPRVGGPEQALQGFLKANGLSSPDQAEIRETDKGTFYFAVREQRGQDTVQVLPGLIGDALQAFTWRKSMRWSKGSFRWVRPLHGVLVVFDGRAIEGQVALGKKDSLVLATTTRGHRFLAPDPFPVTSFSDYRDKLRKRHVLIDRDERRRTIIERSAKLAEAAGLEVKEDPGLIEEIVGLLEWPVVLIGEIDQGFMDLPAEVLITSMRRHQKYIALLDQDGRLADRFLVVANTDVPTGRSAIIAGYERVLRARLSDARFFWDQDRKQRLADRVEGLAAIVFHAKLGTLAQKVGRTEALARDIAALIPGAEPDAAAAAAKLAKADLNSHMVGEFPELQGVMGRYYALNDGESGEIADAIAEHYSPLGPKDRCPMAPLSVTLSLADKLDSLSGFFAVGEVPTGSKDPFALRRAALGVIRLILENRLRLPLLPLLEAAYGRFDLGDREDPSAAVLAFIADRLKVTLKDQGARYDLISAVFSTGGEDDLYRLMERVKALEGFLAREDGGNLLVAYRRAGNIVRIEEKKDRTSFRGKVKGELFRQDEESQLFDALARATDQARGALKREDFVQAMTAIAETRQPVDRFFDQVTVNSDEPELRDNRLKLLSQIGAMLNQVADFSKIEG